MNGGIGGTSILIPRGVLFPRHHCGSLGPALLSPRNSKFLWGSAKTLSHHRVTLLLPTEVGTKPARQPPPKQHLVESLRSSVPAHPVLHHTLHGA